MCFIWTLHIWMSFKVLSSSTHTVILTVTDTVGPWGRYSWWTTPLATKKTVSITLTFDRTWRAFWVLGTFDPSIGMIGLSFQCHNHKPMIHHRLQFLTRRFHLYLNDQAVSDKGWRDWLFCRRSSGVVQISQRRGLSSILRSKSRNKTQLIFHILRQVP